MDEIQVAKVSKSTGKTSIQGDEVEEDVAKEEQNAEASGILAKDIPKITSSESSRDQSVPKHMKPGIYGQGVSQADLEIGARYLIITPANIVSPSEISLVLEVSSGCFAAVQEELPKKLTEDRGDWRLRRNDTVAVLSNEVWYRGVARYKKRDGEVTVYLVDKGHFCCVDSKDVLPLPTELYAYPACAIQVNEKFK